MSDTQFKSKGNVITSVVDAGGGGTVIVNASTGTQAQTAQFLSLAAVGGNLVDDGAGTITYNATPDLANANSTITDDFQGNNTGNTLYDLNGWVASSTNSGATNSNTSRNHPGVVDITTSGSGTADVTTIQLGTVNCLFPADGTTTMEAVVNVTTVAANNNYLFGLQDGTAAPSAVVNGIFWSCNGANSKWIMNCCKASTRTATNTTTAVVAATWYKLGIVVNSAFNSIQFFINGVSAGTVTTNIPLSTTGMNLQFRAGCPNGGGNTLHVDYVKYYQVFNTPR